MEESMTTFEKVLGIVAEHRDLDISKATPDTTFAELGLDSLDLVELIMAMEEAFGTTIELTNDVKTLGQAAALVDKA